MIEQRAKRDFWLAVRRGATLRCPRCGKGRLFRAYLKPVSCCAACGEELSHIRADDGPAWLTVLVTGHVVAGSALGLDSVIGLPLWQSMAGFCTMALVMCLVLLPHAKGIFIGAIWAGEQPKPG